MAEGTSRHDWRGFMAWLRGLHGMAEGGNGGATPAFWQCRTGAGDGKNALLDETKTAWTCRKTTLWKIATNNFFRTDFPTPAQPSTRRFSRPKRQFSPPSANERLSTPFLLLAKLQLLVWQDFISNWQNLISFSVNIFQDSEIIHNFVRISLTKQRKNRAPRLQSEENQPTKITD